MATRSVDTKICDGRKEVFDPPRVAEDRSSNCVTENGHVRHLPNIRRETNARHIPSDRRASDGGIGLYAKGELVNSKHLVVRYNTISDGDVGRVAHKHSLVAAFNVNSVYRRGRTGNSDASAVSAQDRVSDD